MTKSSGNAGRSEARLAAVQALYQLEMVAGVSAQVIAEFKHHRLEPSADSDLFGVIVEGVAARLAAIDGRIGSALVESWTVERLETVLRAILRAGTFEIESCPEVPAKVAINDYIGIARAFYGGREPALVNGVLDRIGRDLRPAEFASA